jgi:tyrosyl-tRNA synthetase
MTPEQQLEILCGNAVDVISRAELLEKLREGRPLRIKYGADPSAPDLHLGHSVPLTKLRQFQDLGHQVVFIIGDFTGRIGDPSGKSKTRPVLDEETIQRNAATYAAQVGKILDVGKCEVRYNSEWFGKMSAGDMLALASHYTVAQMLERDDFAKRMANETPISLLEMMYPLVQGYDSVMVEADVEIGGTDQTFNFLVGRVLMRAHNQTPQVVMTWPLLVGLDGHDKMSKSLGNYVGITDAPGDMFGKLMSIPDNLMPNYYRLLLTYDEAAVAQMTGEIEAGRLHPKAAKVELAKAIIARYHDAAAAEAAEAEFERVFAQKQVPTDMPEVALSAADLAEGKIGIVALIVKAGHADTNGEARRLVRQGAVTINSEKIADENALVTAADGDVLQVGKRRFARVRVG